MNKLIKRGFIFSVFLLLSKSYAQIPDNALLICTSYRNELAAQGFTNIFEHNGKYCVILADTTMEALNDISEKINNGLMSLINPSDNENFEQWKERREEEKEQGLLDEFVSWPTDDNNRDLSEYKSGIAKDETVEQWVKRRKAEKELGLLDEFINWATGENFSIDTERYQGIPKGKSYNSKSQEGAFLEGMFNFWNVD